MVKYLYEKIYFRLACYFFYLYSGSSSTSAVGSSTDGCYYCCADGGQRKRQPIMNNNSNEKISQSSATSASKGGSAATTSLSNFHHPTTTTNLVTSSNDENRFALTKQPGATVQNHHSRSRPVPRPLVASVPNPKETVLPTAFVSPQTVQISVQPLPNVGTHSPHHQHSPIPSSNHPGASVQQHQSPFPSPPPTPRRQGPSLSALVAHYLSPPNSSGGAGLSSKVADAYCGGGGDDDYESSVPAPPFRRMSMAAAAAAATADRPWTSNNRRSWVAGGTTNDSSLVSFRTDYSPTEDLNNPVNRSQHRFSLDSASFGYAACDADTGPGGRRFGVAAPSTRNVSASDERLNMLERRLRLLESRLPLGSQPTAAADFADDHDDYQQPSGVDFSRSMKDLSTDTCAAAAGGGRMAGGRSCQLPTTSQSSSYQNLTAGGDNNCDKVQCMSQKIRDLQKILEEDRVVTAVDWRRAKADEYKQAYNNSHEMKNFLKTSQSLDDLMRERNSLQDTVESLKEKLEKASTAASLAPDQYVTMQRYRLLKAKSKKLLQDKCEALRAAVLEKESALVRMQLQNKELSELRRKVYEHECQCKDKNQDENCSDGGAKLDRLREELLQLCKSTAQTSSCLLGVCRDVSNKRCPDYDQILGLKTSDDENLRKSLKNLRGSTGSLNSCTVTNVDPAVYTEQLVALHKCTLQNLNQMQKLMVDYYTNELVESVDCRIQ